MPVAKFQLTRQQDFSLGGNGLSHALCRVSRGTVWHLRTFTAKLMYRLAPSDCLPYTTVPGSENQCVFHHCSRQVCRLAG